MINELIKVIPIREESGDWRMELIIYSFVIFLTLKLVRLEHREFFKRCDKELIKVNNFYSEKLTEANRRLASFGLIALDGSGQGQGGDGCVTANSKAYKRTQRKKTELCKLKMAVGELYLGLVFLQSYQELNYRGFCKITKKYDAKFACEYGLQWRTEKLDTSFIYTERTRCGQMMVRLEVRILLIAHIFFIFILQWLANAHLCVQVWNEPHLEHLKALQLYRGSFLLIEFLFFMGLSMCCWGKSGINQVLIFELDPRQHLSHLHVLEVAGCLAVCWCASVLASLHSSLLSVPQQLHPLFFHSLLLLLLLNPTPTCHSRSRRWLLTWNVLTAAFRPVGFAECWLADQLNSLSPLILKSLDWEKQSKVVPCLIQCFPPWLRFTQCLRCFWDSGRTLHLLNAGKYSTVFLMVTFAGLYNIAKGRRAAPPMEVNAYLYLWAVATCLSVLVTISWDLRMDWGLLQGNGLLKEELVYSREVYYYAAMLADVLLRISWAINILLFLRITSVHLESRTILFQLYFFCRRSMWNLFRLENEHLKNCEQCRAVRDFEFPSRTVNMPEQFLQEKLMDQDELDNTEPNTTRANREEKKKEKRAWEEKVRVQHFSLQRTVVLCSASYSVFTSAVP
uniref:XK-related protein n=1 Tax=Pygocentrus nattereri TaxID=42514 RepID=A0A3B4D7G5_PYGNA